MGVVNSPNSAPALPADRRRPALGPMGWGGALVTAWIVASLPGCTPALDWREARWPEAGLMAMFPCRPASQQRVIAVASQSLTMTLHVCDAGGATFALTHAEVNDVTQVGPVLAALRDAAAGNLGGAALNGGRAWSVPGMTPRPQGGQWQLSGRMPDGRTVAAVMATTSHGAQVVQISVTADSLSEGQIQPFLDGVRFLP